MALKTDDCDVNDVRFMTTHGGNGDYYITLIKYDEDGVMKSRIDYRMAMSGGATSNYSDVRLAMGNLFRAIRTVAIWVASVGGAVTVAWELVRYIAEKFK